jgi:iron complex transport system ATP-binding protein
MADGAALARHGGRAQGEALLQARALSYSVAQWEILREVSLAVRPGEFVGLIGPNGAGKTTLLRLLVGVLQPSAGEVLLGGRPLAGVPLRQRARLLSYLSQEGGAPFPFAVLDVVLMGRYPHVGRFRRETEADLEAARRALAYVGLSGFEGRYFSELSGGERQLVLFARVLAQETEVLLLDEPTSNLDIEHQDRLFSMASELAQEKKAVIAALHNLNVASQYCSRLLLLHRGRLVAEGPPREVLRREILDPVYDTHTVVTSNASTGSLVVNVAPRGTRQQRRGLRVHLIGGAGSAVNLTREMRRLGLRLSGGIAHEYDADQILWANLGIPTCTVGAFAHIGPEDVERAAGLVEAAEITVLCSFPVGAANSENLRLAQRARRLVIVDPGPEEVPRSFFSEEGRGLFRQLEGQAPCLSYRDLLDALRSGELAQA